MNAKEMIARRVAKELKDGDVVNLVDWFAYSGSKLPA